MQRLALAIALAALVGCALPAPGLYVALGLAIAAVGVGLVGYGQRGAPGFHRLAAAGAITVGGVALLLAGLRVVLVLAAIDHLYSVM